MELNHEDLAVCEGKSFGQIHVLLSDIAQLIVFLKI